MEGERIRVACRVGKGWSETEYIVALTDFGGVARETWADREIVNIDDRTGFDQYDAKGSVEVRSVSEDLDRLLIELPNESVSSGRRVWISRETVR